MAIYDESVRGYRIFIGNLNPKASSRDIEYEFRRYGEIEDIWVARDPPGFGFVLYKRRRPAEEAVRRTDGRYLFSQRITVEHAKPRGSVTGPMHHRTAYRPVRRHREPADYADFRRRPPPRRRDPDRYTTRRRSPEYNSRNTRLPEAYRSSYSDRRSPIDHRFSSVSPPSPHSRSMTSRRNDSRSSNAYSSKRHDLQRLVQSHKSLMQDHEEENYEAYSPSNSSHSDI